MSSYPGGGNVLIKVQNWDSDSGDLLMYEEVVLSMDRQQIDNLVELVERQPNWLQLDFNVYLYRGRAEILPGLVLVADIPECSDSTPSELIALVCREYESFLAPSAPYIFNPLLELEAFGYDKDTSGIRVEDLRINNQCKANGSARVITPQGSLHVSSCGSYIRVKAEV
ncbi:MAG: hypothetical protein HONBIEJF_02589 [Fimbriimonadaceae bacterium]|nr:hypothetical protein [Fimbriimonadaceae bacterium]